MQGKTIGLSNFLQDNVENTLTSFEIKPMVNQVLAYVSNTPFELIFFVTLRLSSLP